jgi:glycosyltransferase involved in cell wall biosynthesis
MYEPEIRLKKNLIIISLLDGKGPTGVEAHFNQLIHEARAYGVDGVLISPYPSNMVWTKFARVFVRAVGLVNKEHAAILARWVDSKVIEKKLNAMVSSDAFSNDSLTFYAQDPLSARAALKIRKKRACRVASVIHYNVSEASELVLKGEGKVDGPLWRSVMANESQTLLQVDQIIFVSEFMRKALLERLPKIAAVPQTVIPNFVVPPKPDNNTPIIGGDMISIGTLEPRKNQAFLLQVLAKTNALGYSYTLTLVGNGPDEPRLKELARKLGLGNQVQFIGFQKNAARLIPQHRILVHAARAENMPITLIEALAFARPILAPAVGGITEIFHNAVEGYYWDINDVDGAATLLIKTLSEPETYRSLAKAAQLRYQKRFDSNLLLTEWLATIFNQQNISADSPAIPALSASLAGI